MNKHQIKVKKARKLLSNEEKRAKTSIFSSKNWLARAYDRRGKELLKVHRAHVRRLKRIEQEAMANSPL